LFFDKKYNLNYPHLKQLFMFCYNGQKGGSQLLTCQARPRTLYTL